MKIALLHYTYAEVVGGVEIVLAAQARLFSENGHEVTVICGNAAPGAAPARVVAVAEIANPNTPVAALKASLRPLLATQEVVILHNVLTMHFHLALTIALWALAEELSAVRFICWVHDLAAINPDYAPLDLDQPPGRLLTQAHPHCTYVAVSELRRWQFLRLTSQPEHACRTIPNGVEPSHLLNFSPTIATFEQRHHLLSREVVLLHPTRLLRRKNVELTLAVTAAIKAAGYSCACLITAPPDVHHAASSAYAAELRTLQTQLGLEQDAFFLHDSGPLSSEDLRSLFELADALFFPSRQEGFGLPLLEAAVHRLPIFCADLEPLNSLLGAAVTTFPLTASPAALATLVLSTLHASPAAQARRQVLQNYSWRGIYGNFLAPLLAESST